MTTQQRNIVAQDILKGMKGKVVVCKAWYYNGGLVFDKWTQEREKYLFDGVITDQNQREIMEDEVIIEFDIIVTKEQSHSNFEAARREANDYVKKISNKLKQFNIGHRITAHIGGKSPHLRFHVQGLGEYNEEIRSKYKLFVAQEMLDLVNFKNDFLMIDEGLLSKKHLIQLEGAKHPKPEYNGAIEEVLDTYIGNNLLIKQDIITRMLVGEDKDKKEDINSSITKRIVAKVKLSELAEEIKAGKGTNGNYYCPFHDDKNPSLSIDDERGLFNCFGGSCKKKGNIVDFVVLADKVTIREAIRRLLIRAGIKNKVDYRTAFTGEDGKIVDYRMIAEIFFKEQPYFYDTARLWWIWDIEQYRWKIVDEVDVMNKIDEGLPYWKATIEPTIKGKIIEALKRIGRLNTPKDAKKTWVQFKNMIIDIETEEKFEATSEYFITNPIPWEQGETEETPIIDKIFKEWVGEEYVITLKEIMAFSTLTYMPVHRIFCLIGVGLNGKSSFIRLIEMLLSKENVTSSSIERLTNGHFETAKLYKKLVVVIGEIDKEIFKKTSLLKSLSGDDLIPIEFKNKNPFDSHNYAKPIIASNRLPETNDKTKGFFRRWCIIDFPNKFLEKGDILINIPPHEFNNFCKSIPKIVKQIVRNGGFTNEGDIEQREQKYISHSSPINQFIQEHCLIGENQKIEFSIFYKEFSAFIEDHGYPKVSENLTGRLLNSMGYKNKNITIYDEFKTPITSASTRIGINLKDTE